MDQNDHFPFFKKYITIFCHNNYYFFIAGLDSDNDNDPPLAHQAAASGDVALLVQAIKQDPGILEHRDTEGMYKYTPGLRLKIKRNDWLLVDTCPQAANHCALFSV